MAAKTPLVAGNWKMNGLGAALGELRALKDRLALGDAPDAEIIVCLPATLLSRARDILVESGIRLGAQDCHPLPSGAHTGDISAEMLADAGASAVIVGHSERRHDHGETDALVNAKARAAFRAGLTAILCIGETEEERQNGATLETVGRQLEFSLPREARAANCVIAYEPVWAIGSGRTPSPSEIHQVHRMIREQLGHLYGAAATRIRILYGGSVAPENLYPLLELEEVDGGLVGGASLEAAKFATIVSAAAAGG